MDHASERGAVAVCVGWRSPRSVCGRKPDHRRHARHRYRAGVADPHGPANLADVGNESNPSPLGFDVTFEGAVYGSANAPSEFGTVWGAVSVLPGLRIGAGPQMRYGLVFGPTIFFGQTTEVRPFLAVRFEVPMGRSKAIQ